MISKRLLLNCAAILILAVPSWAQEYWPTQSWRATTPEQQGMDSEKLREALDYIQQRDLNIHSMLIVRSGYVVLDAYFYPYNEKDVHDVASVTKGITSTLVGIAIERGKIKSVREPVLGFFSEDPVAHNEARKQRLTVEHLLTMTSGFQCEPKNNELTLLQMKQSDNWIKFMLDLPMAEEPGRKFVYCSGGMHVLSGIISRVTGESASDFARRSLFEPLGIRDAVWPSDPQGVSQGWGNLHLHPRDMAKIGYLWLNRGIWNGRHLMSADWVDQATRVHAGSGPDNEYGYGLWIRSGAGLYEALGRGGQRISVVPSKNIIVVFTGGGFNPGEIGKFLLAAVKSDQPLPENRPAVTRLDVTAKRAAIAPSPKPVQPLPPLAAKISGKVFEFDQNPLGLKELSLTFKPGPEASLRLSLADDRFTNKLVSVRAIGLDGVPRLSSDGRFGLPVGLKGFWKDNETFVFDYDEIANINDYRFELKLSEKEVFVKLAEKTGTAQLSFAGKLKPY
jgi:CubicO group peptidase (beta-lactamase class C family)